MSFKYINQLILPLGRITPTGVSLLGTAAVINKDGCLVTAAHVTNNDDTNLVVVVNKTPSFYDYQDTTDTNVKGVPVKIEAIDPFTDLCIIKSETNVKFSITIGGADNCVPGDSVAIFGYPHADKGRMVLTQHVTQIGAKVLIESGNIKTKHLILNVQARPGQSGSPIFNLNSMQLVGILIGSYAPNNGGGIIIGDIDPQTLHQTTQAISSEYIKEML